MKLMCTEFMSYFVVILLQEITKAYGALVKTLKLINILQYGFTILKNNYNHNKFK